MALWGGVMRVADRCKITEKIARIVSVPLSFLFKGLRDIETLKVISLNVTANLLGLGNAATPLGIQAMKRLHSSHADSPQYLSYTAMLVLLNTASIQLIPLTTSAMRATHGAENPWDCVVPTILTSAVSLMFGIVVIKLIYSRKIQKEKSHEHDSAAHNRRNIHHSHGKAC
jgi:spore maturation protein A